MTWCIAALLAATTAVAQRPGAWITPCRADTQQSDDAQAAFESLRDRFEASSAAATDLAELRRAYERVIALECFRPAREARRGPRFESLAGIRRWWFEGGESWLAQYLPSVDAPEDEEEEWVVFPADEVSPLRRSELSPDDPLAELICDPADDACGAETSGWLRRAEELFERWPLVERGLENEIGPLATERAIAECERRARRTSASRRWIEWYDCVEDVHALHAQAATPSSGFRAPTHGWLVTQGAYGSYHPWCTTLSALDLATGAAYVIEHCQAMEDEPPRWREHVGVVARDNLREAALMIFLAPAMRQPFQPFRSVPAPRGLERRWREDAARGTVGPAYEWRTTAQRPVHWRWFRDRRVTQGTYIWSPSALAGHHHAWHTMDIALAGLGRTCPPTAPPNEALAWVNAELAARLRSARAARCPRRNAAPQR